MGFGSVIPMIGFKWEVKGRYFFFRFGNMEKIMDSVKTIFYIITILLTIAGIISIPVLIFLIITYMIIKSLVGRFTVL